MTPVEHVLDRARWAPSGDNSQPWRFRLVSPYEADILTFDTRRECVYDLNGRASQIAVGALLETVRIAASALRLKADIERRPTPTDEELLFRLRLVDDRTSLPDPLADGIETRSTQRRSLSRRPLGLDEKRRLDASVRPPHRLLWIEGPQRWSMASLMYYSAKIRLTIPEAYAVHSNAIEWQAVTSDRKIPDKAVGLDPVGLVLMRWAMKSWNRTRILSLYFGGTVLPRLQLELVPGLRCSAHVLICAPSPPSEVDHYLEAGAAVQRFWLTAEGLGLRHQPALTPLIFAGYHREGLRFSSDPRAIERAGRVRERLTRLVGEQAAATAVWMGRVGAGSPPLARSLRQSLQELCVR